MPSNLKAVFFLATGFLLAFLPFRASPQTPPKTEQKSKAVLPSSSLLQKSIPLVSGFTNYEWIDDTSFLSRKSMNPPLFVRQNLSPPLKMTLSKLSKVTRRETMSIFYSLSPDKKWILWGDQQGDDLVVIASRIDGAKVCTWKRKLPYRTYQFSRLLWLSDSQRWMILLQKPGHLRVYVATGDLKHPNKFRFSSFAFNAPVVEYWGPTFLLLAIDGKNRVLALGNRGRSPETVGKYAGTAPLLEFTIGTKKANVRVSRIARPKAEFIETIKYAPATQRLLWVCQVATETYEIRTSKRDGSDPHFLGRVVNSPEGKNFIPESVRWLPNGKQVSFACGEDEKAGYLFRLWKIDDKN